MTEFPYGRAAGSEVAAPGFGPAEVISSWITPGAAVLDVGCWTGDLLGRLSVSHQCQVVGIEPDARAAAHAVAAGIETIVAGGLEASFALQESGRRFHHVIFADVLEHVSDPVEMLRRFEPLLDRDGTFLISIPNIGFLPARAKIARGLWEYEDSGIFDRTHLRFYTVRSGREMVEAAALRIERDAYVGPLATRLGQLGARLTGLRPGLLAKQMVFEASLT